MNEAFCREIVAHFAATKQAASNAAVSNAAVATLVDVRGSVPQALGARILVRADGSTYGTIGGGAVEHFVIEQLRARCASPSFPSRLSIDLTKDLGMCCGGGMVFLMENLVKTERLIIFGAGHVAVPTAAIARAVGFSVLIVDDREELNTESRFPSCERILAEPAEARELLTTTEQDFLLVVTHDHHLDEEALRAFCEQPHRYIGLIGSQRKVIKLRERVVARGVTIDDARFYAPVGVRLGATTPEEIAISIVGELIAVRHGETSAHMRFKRKASESST